MGGAPAGWTGAQRAVAAELVRYGAELEIRGDAQFGGSFSGDPDADRLIEERPEAFLFGVLFTQGIRAERAWQGPRELYRRLGHLDLARLAREGEALRAAFQRAPMLHRFKETLPRWIGAAADRLIEEYGGDASRIWAPGSHALDVVERLSEFDGIGRKKAAMAVELLVRHFRVPLGGLETGEAAFDVHVRRVFLRSGLVDEDAPDAVARASRLACPDAPGTLDLPAWLIGRETCRPKTPRCDVCRLGAVCLRRTWLTPDGVGVRRGPVGDGQSRARKSSPESSFG